MSYIDVKVYHNDTNISDLVLYYERTKQICSSIGELSITLVNNGRSYDAWDIIKVYELGTKRGEYYIGSVNRSVNDKTITLSCQDGSKRLSSYFISDTYEITEKTTTTYWIKKFLNEMGVSYSFSASASVPVSNNTQLGLSSGYDTIITLLQYTGWYMYFNESNTAIIGALTGNEGTSLYFTENDIIDIKTNKSDKMLRNRAVIWGNCNPDTDNWVYVDKSVTTPWDYDSKDKRAVVISNHNIKNNSQANKVANKLISEFSKLNHEKEITIVGSPDTNLGVVVSIETPQIVTSGLITTISVSFSSSGLVTTLKLGERCPRLYGFWGPYSPVTPENPVDPEEVIPGIVVYTDYKIKIADHITSTGDATWLDRTGNLNDLGVPFVDGCVIDENTAYALTQYKIYKTTNLSSSVPHWNEIYNVGDHFSLGRDPELVRIVGRDDTFYVSMYAHKTILDKPVIDLLYILYSHDGGNTITQKTVENFTTMTTYMDYKKVEDWYPYSTGWWYYTFNHVHGHNLSWRPGHEAEFNPVMIAYKLSYPDDTYLEFRPDDVYVGSYTHITLDDHIEGKEVSGQPWDWSGTSEISFNLMGEDHGDTGWKYSPQTFVYPNINIILDIAGESNPNIYNYERIILDDFIPIAEEQFGNWWQWSWTSATGTSSFEYGFREWPYYPTDYDLQLIPERAFIIENSRDYGMYFNDSQDRIFTEVNFDYPPLNNEINNVELEVWTFWAAPRSRALAIGKNDTNIVYVNGNGKVYRSINGGTTFYTLFENTLVYDIETFLPQASTDWSTKTYFYGDMSLYQTYGYNKFDVPLDTDDLPSETPLRISSNELLGTPVYYLHGKGGGGPLGTPEWFSLVKIENGVATTKQDNLYDAKSVKQKDGVVFWLTYNDICFSADGGDTLISAKGNWTDFSDPVVLFIL